MAMSELVGWMVQWAGIGLVCCGSMAAAPPAAPDPRNFANGQRIPVEGYCDQPRIMVTQDEVVRRARGRFQGVAYPTDCAKTIIWSGRSLSFVPSAFRSTEALAPVARPSEAQKRYAFWEI